MSEGWRQKLQGDRHGRMSRMEIEDTELEMLKRGMEMKRGERGEEVERERDERKEPDVSHIST